MAAVLPNMIRVGLINTLILAASSTVLGAAIGMGLALMGISRNPVLRIASRVYADVFRGLPAVVTILLIGQGLREGQPRGVRADSPIRSASWP